MELGATHRGALKCVAAAAATMAAVVGTGTVAQALELAPAARSADTTAQCVSIDPSAAMQTAIMRTEFGQSGGRSRFIDGRGRDRRRVR
jgi:hypothetical protein